MNNSGQEFFQAMQNGGIPMGVSGMRRLSPEEQATMQAQTLRAKAAQMEDDAETERREQASFVRECYLKGFFERVGHERAQYIDWDQAQVQIALDESEQLYNQTMVWMQNHQEEGGRFQQIEEVRAQAGEADHRAAIARGEAGDDFDPFLDENEPPEHRSEQPFLVVERTPAMTIAHINLDSPELAERIQDEMLAAQEREDFEGLTQAGEEAAARSELEELP